jgi:dUTP pyrophosphatase
MRSFEFARKIVDGKFIEEKAYPYAQLPEYQTVGSAGADFFCAEDVVVKSVWHQFLGIVGEYLTGKGSKSLSDIEPTLIHTGIKARMEEDEVLELYNRSSNPRKLGLVLANGVAVIDGDYVDNADNDGEIMFNFYNFKPWDVTIEKGTRIGQGVFKKFLRPEVGLRVKDAERTGGLGSTGN